MKIFNWVHRRFANKEELTESGKKSCAFDGDGENNVVNVFDGWKQGILTIGTLGYAYEQKHECCFDEKANEEEISSDSEETKPLVYAKDMISEEYEEIGRDHDSCTAANGDQEFELELHNYNKERITLAQLFSADTDKKLHIPTLTNPPSNHDKGQVIKVDQQEQHYYKKNNNNSKLTTADARPIYKLHRMMRRMMKRQIHPDEGLNSPKTAGDININITTVTETALLVPCQGEDAII